MSKAKHILAIIISLTLLLTVVVILGEAEKNTKKENITSESKKISHPPASIIDVFPVDTYAKITAFGEVVSHREATLKANIKGEVVSVSNNLQEGKIIKKGEVLFTFNIQNYRTKLAQAMSQVEEANLLLQTEKEKARVIRQDWKILQKKGRPSEFILRVPQIKAAQAQLKFAKTHLAESKKISQYAKIIAPYNSIVLSRSTYLGDVVEIGQELTRIMSLEKLNIKLRLDDRQWELLTTNWKGKKAKIHSINTDEQWIAIVERKGELLDNKTRQRTLYLTISSTKKPLVGSFIKVEITGRKLSKLLKIPASAYTPDGYIWFVNKQNKLKRFLADIVFSDSSFVFVTPPNQDQEDGLSSPKKAPSFSIVVYPLSSFFPEVEVSPIPLSDSQSMELKSRNTGK